MRELLGRGLDRELAGSVPPAAPPSGAWRWEIAVVALVVAANLLQNRVVPDAWHVLTGPLLALAAVLLARRAGASWALLGLDRRYQGRGLRLGLVAVGVVAAVLVVVAALPGGDAVFEDERVVDRSAGAVVYAALVRVPLATALTEEVLFRGVAYGLLARRLGAWRAMLVESALFGLWHVLPTLATVRDNPVTQDLGAPSAVAGAVATTFVAGLVFTWLRRRSGSVAAPWLAHVATNGLTLLVALAVTR